MALSKIRLANKKYKRERRRLAVQKKWARINREVKLHDIRENKRKKILDEDDIQ